MSTAGETVRLLRENLGVSQRRLAALMHNAGFDWHQPTVQRTESGKRELRLGEAYKLAAILGCSIDQMAGHAALPEATIVASLQLAISVLEREMKGIS